MKLLAIPAFLCFVLCGQEPPPHVPPGTTAPPAAQQAPAAPAIAPDAVVATIGEKKLTAADVDKLLEGLPPQFIQAARAQPQQALTQIFFVRHLAELAEREGLDKRSPYKEALEYQRTQTLAQAEVATHANTITASPEEDAAYYKAHGDKYRQAKVRVIYVAFDPSSGQGASEAKKLPAEADAKKKIEGLRQQIIAGADFGKLAKENSDDKGSAEKGGDFGTITPASPYPDQVKNAVFALKAGDMSAPVRMSNGYYLIRVDSFEVQPLKDVEEQINREIRNERINEWIKGIQSQYAVTIENPAYFTPKAPPLQLQKVH